MTPRLTSALLVNALVRRVNAAGGHATVLAKGDPGAGAILIVAVERGVDPRLWERGYDSAGRPALVATGPDDGDAAAVADYWRRRRARDRDLWVIELDVAAAKRFAAETIVGD